MSSIEPSSKQEEPNPHFPPNYHFGLSLDEYLHRPIPGSATQIKLISRDENTALTLWKGHDGTEFMLRLFYKGDCKAALVMDANEFDRVVKQLLEASSDEP